MSTESAAKKTNFIRQIIDQDLESGKTKQVATRFPPEPNGFLHIGHAKSVCLNFSLAEDYKGKCHLRFDDTNPIKEDEKYARAIEEDIRWLGFSWGDHLFHASDYFDKLYEYARLLVERDLAYVCSLNAEEVRKTRGTLTEPGKPSPDRDRPPAESLDLLERMKKGEFEEGQYTLRAKIDMASPNLNMRDPAMYRIRKIPHQRTGDTWCIYPMYDFAHGISDAIEGITHSICTLEFEDHRPLYDWFNEKVGFKSPPQQIEFAKLNIDYMVFGKRHMLRLVEEKHVDGWDDPRMPTLAGVRRLGFTPNGIREFCEKVGVTKKNSRIELSTLENIVRSDLDETVPRAMAVLDPVKVTIENFEDGKEETLSSWIHPKKQELGRREFPFTKEIYIEREDFEESPPPKFKRLSPGEEVRLKNAYVVRCERVEKNSDGSIKNLVCTYLPETLGGKPPEHGKKPKGIIHWVSASKCLDAEVRLYDRLFSHENPMKNDEGKDFVEYLNPNSLEVMKNAKLEVTLASAKPEDKFQFERIGFFCADRHDHSNDKPVFNRTLTLRDNWQKK